MSPESWIGGRMKGNKMLLLLLLLAGCDRTTHVITEHVKNRTISYHPEGREDVTCFYVINSERFSCVKD